MVDPKIRARHETIIRALQAKTVERGCTEAEALEAAAKAKELMDRFEIDELSDEEIISEGAVRMFWVADNLTELSSIALCAVAISKFTDTTVYWSPTMKHQRTKPLGVMGLRSDVDFALFLLNTLSAFGMAGASTEAPHARIQYLKGYCLRVSQRLNEMIQKRKEGASGRALVVFDTKAAAINAFMNSVGLKTRKSPKQKIAASNATFAGMKRGDQATFARPVGGNESKLLG